MTDIYDKKAEPGDIILHCFTGKISYVKKVNDYSLNIIKNISNVNLFYGKISIDTRFIIINKLNYDLFEYYKTKANDFMSENPYEIIPKKNINVGDFVLSYDYYSRYIYIGKDIYMYIGNQNPATFSETFKIDKYKCDIYKQNINDVKVRKILSNLNDYNISIDDFISFTNELPR